LVGAGILLIVAVLMFWVIVGVIALFTVGRGRSSGGGFSGGGGAFSGGSSGGGGATGSW
jgi:uncharacterized protein